MLHLLLLYRIPCTCTHGMTAVVVVTDDSSEAKDAEDCDWGKCMMVRIFSFLSCICTLYGVLPVSFALMLIWCV